MWCSVGFQDVKSDTPSSRTKHSATLVGESIYVLGGRNGNVAKKDFWKYNLVTGLWKQLSPSGEKLPSLQEHSAVTYKNSIYIFGGEVGFSAGTETPLWVYDIKENSWRKLKTKKGTKTPKGRRGHTALVHNDTMLLYGGYQDLRGSCGDIWAFHFETESWHILSSLPNKSNENYPAPRHKHSAVIHDDALWIYGGMTDLQERNDLWKWDFRTKAWTSIKTKLHPGTLHSHSACKIPSWMIIFGGERNGQCFNDMWKFSFEMEYWEKITVPGQKPQPRSESTAIVVSELQLKSRSKCSFEYKAERVRARTANSADRGNRHSSYLSNNRIAPCEKTYIFEPTELSYNDGSNLAKQYSDNQEASNRQTFLQEIKKLSQLNLGNTKCSYTILSTKNTESTESLLRQHSSPQQETVLSDTEITSTPSRGAMVKSKSAFVIEKHSTISPTLDEEIKTTTKKKRVGFDNTVKKIARDNISVPNFSLFNLPPTVLTPVEATKLVYLDDEKIDLTNTKGKIEESIITTEKNININLQKDLLYINPIECKESFKVKRGESYSSHLAYADNPLYEEINAQKKSEENVSSTSDYCSIETVNRLSSNSSYSVRTNTPQEECLKTNKDKEGPFGFCNPNYLDPSVKSMLTNNEKKSFATILSQEPLDTTDQSESEEVLELQSFNGVLDTNTKVIYRSASRSNRPSNLTLNKNHCVHSRTPRALSVGRVELKKNEAQPIEKVKTKDLLVPLYMYIIGGKEQGHVTAFNRPISIWKMVFAYYGCISIP